MSWVSLDARLYTLSDGRFVKQSNGKQNLFMNRLMDNWSNETKFTSSKRWFASFEATEEAASDVHLEDESLKCLMTLLGVPRLCLRCCLNDDDDHHHWLVKAFMKNVKIRDCCKGVQYAYNGENGVLNQFLCGFVFVLRKENCHCISNMTHRNSINKWV